MSQVFDVKNIKGIAWIKRDQMESVSNYRKKQTDRQQMVPTLLPNSPDSKYLTAATFLGRALESWEGDVALCYTYQHFISDHQPAPQAWPAKIH